MQGPDTRILVIDDHEDNRVLLKLILESRGFGYLGAASGPEGLAIARQERPDLILLDLQMPGMDGFEVLMALKAHSVTRTIPVIILTATYLEPKSVERGLSLGADEYLTKPINPDEILVRIRSVIRVREAERELRQLRKDFSSMLVHDLRSPLEGIGIALNLLLGQELAERDAHQLVQLARDQVLDMSRMIEDLMELHRAEAGLSLASENVNPRHLVADVAAESDLLAQSKGLALSWEAPDDLPLLLGDRRILKRVLTNLVGNALKFTHQGAVAIRITRMPEALSFEVRDTGPGIPPDELARVFDKYFHIQRRKERPEHGFGLGLAFCKLAVEEHQGTIRVASEVGKGTVFTVELPLTS
ncbi:hybrid sensor histidine kinase/response regulator [bacterium]|nr:hybrid sensor histidine kinase/response regulator [bacterium]